MNTFFRFAFLIPALTLFTFLMVSQAQATPLAGMNITIRQTQELRQVKIENNNEVVLQLDRDEECPLNMVCGTDASGNREFRMVIEEETQDPCGATLYKGTQKKEQVTVVDNSHLSCLIRRPVTEVFVGNNGGL